MHSAVPRPSRLPISALPSDPPTAAPQRAASRTVPGPDRRHLPRRRTGGRPSTSHRSPPDLKRQRDDAARTGRDGRVCVEGAVSRALSVASAGRPFRSSGSRSRSVRARDAAQSGSHPTGPSRPDRSRSSSTAKSTRRTTGRSKLPSALPARPKSGSARTRGCHVGRSTSPNPTRSQMTASSVTSHSRSPTTSRAARAVPTAAGRCSSPMTTRWWDPGPFTVSPA